MLKKVALSVVASSLLLSGCGNWNIKAGTSGIKSANDYDNDTGDIIRQERDAYGELTDCTVGKSSERRDLPSCNSIKQQRNDQVDEGKQVSNDLLSNNLSGSSVFVLPSGGKLRINTSAVFNDELMATGQKGGGELIINATVLRENLPLSVFENLFINQGARIDFATLTSGGIMLDHFDMPLNIDAGRASGIYYRKKFGSSTSDLVGMSLQLRRPIHSIREYKQIARLDVGFKP